MKNNFSDIFVKVLIMALGALAILALIYFLGAPSAAGQKTIGQKSVPAMESQSGLAVTELSIEKKYFKVEIAQTDAEKSLGLGGREELSENTGMLFIFREPRVQHFWMKDMKFPIDIVWIDQNKKISGFESNISPDSYPDVYSSKTPISYALELPAGTVENENIQIGELVNFEF